MWLNTTKDALTRDIWQSDVTGIWEGLFDCVKGCVLKRQFRLVKKTHLLAGDVFNG